MQNKIFFKDECYAIQGAIFEVNHQRGAGFLEAVYQECFEREFTFRGIPFLPQAHLGLYYKDEKRGSVVDNRLLAKLIQHPVNLWLTV